MTEKTNDNQQDLSTGSSKEMLEKEFDDLTSKSSYLSKQIRARAEMIIALYQASIITLMSVFILPMLTRLYGELPGWISLLYAIASILTVIFIWDKTTLSAKIYNGCIEKRKKKFVQAGLTGK